MKDESVISKTTTLGSTSYGSTDDDKYGGMISRSWFKTFRRNVSLLYSYVSNLTSFNEYLNNIITFIRLVQFVMISFNPGNLNFWGSDSLSRDTVSVVSFFSIFIFPTQFGQNDSTLLLISKVEKFFSISFLFYFSRYLNANYIRS